MAKTKEKHDLTLAERFKLIRAQGDIINQQAGKVVMYFADSAEAIEKNTIKFIPTPCMELNEKISGKSGVGGFPIGSMTIITGQSDSGKTSLILESIGLQMSKDPDFIVLWVESENSLNNDILDMFHIDRSRFIILTITPEDGGEIVLDRAEALLNTGAFKMFVVNSLRALTPKSIVNKPISEDTMAVHAKMNSKFCAKFCPLFIDKQIAGVIVQHLTSTMATMSRDPFALAGGQQLKYLNLLQLDLRKQSITEADPITREEGMKICAYIRKNHINAKNFPYAKITYYVIYGEGTETKLALLQRGIDKGVLEKAGPYIRFIVPETGEKLQWLGKQAFRDALDDPNLYAMIENACGGLAQDLSDEEISELEKEDAAVEEEIKKVTRGKKKASEEIENEE